MVMRLLFYYYTVQVNMLLHYIHLFTGCLSSCVTAGSLPSGLETCGCVQIFEPNRFLGLVIDLRMVARSLFQPLGVLPEGVDARRSRCGQPHRAP